MNIIFTSNKETYKNIRRGQKYYSVKVTFLLKI